MIRWISIRRAFLTTTLVIVGGAYLASPSQEIAGADMPPRFFESDAEITQRGVELKERQAVLAVRMAYKEQLVNGLLDGTYSLREVSSAFAEANHENETTLNVMRQTYPGATDEEKAAHNVIEYVGLRPIPSCDREAIVANLNAECQRTYAAK